jgi:predicted nucleic-acid-binding protein
MILCPRLRTALPAEKPILPTAFDFADCLIERLGHAVGCRETVTFDVSASRSAGMKLL